MPKRRRQDPQVEEVIQAGMREQKPATDIWRALGEPESPTLRTIQYRVQAEARLRRERWTPTGDASDGRVLECFASVITTTNGRVHVLSKKQGEALGHVLHLAPAIPDMAAWNFAHEYAHWDKASEHLDLSLGFARHMKEIARSQTGRIELGLDGPDIPRPSVQAHVSIHRELWRERPFCAWAGGPSTWTSYMDELGFPFFEPPEEEKEENPRTAEYDRQTWWLWTASAFPRQKEQGNG